MTSDDRLTALRMNGTLFASGVLLMSGLAAIGASFSDTGTAQEPPRFASEGEHVATSEWAAVRGTGPAVWRTSASCETVEPGMAGATPEAPRLGPDALRRRRDRSPDPHGGTV